MVGSLWRKGFQGSYYKFKESSVRPAPVSTSCKGLVVQLISGSWSLLWCLLASWDHAAAEAALDHLPLEPRHLLQ